MQQEQQPYQYSVDYLDQIAPKPPKTGPSGKLKWLLIGFGALALIALVPIVAGFFTSQTDADEVLAARLQNMSQIATKAQKNIKSNQLRGYNSNLLLYLADTNRSLAEHLPARGVDPKKLSESVASAETTRAEELTAALENARLNAIYDRTYSREMAYQLASIKALLQAAYEDTNNKAYKEFLSKSYDNLTPIHKQIAEFNESSD